MGAASRSGKREPVPEPASLAPVDEFFTMSLDLLCIAGTDGYFKRLNPAWSEVLGYSLDELTSEPFVSFVHPDDVELTLAETAKLGQGARTVSFENRYRCKDGSYRWLSWTTVPRPDTGLLYAAARDISPRKKAEEVSAQLAALVQSTDDAIIGWDLDRSVTSWNPSAERMTGWTAAEVIGEPVQAALMRLQPAGAPDLIANYLSGLDLGQRIEHMETVLTGKDGRLVEVSLSMSQVRDATSVLGGSLIARDVTDLKAAERRRGAHDAMLQAIIANSQSLIYVKDIEGRYLLANAPFEVACGVRAVDLVGQTDHFIDPELEPVWRANDLRAQQGAYRLDEWSDAPDGRRYYESVKFPLRDEEGRVYATCGVSLDVTARQRSTLALAEARDAALAATVAKSAFLATMSHEIRTPMNAVIGMTGLLLDTELDARQRDFVATIQHSGDNLLGIINDILDFSKIESGELTLETQSFDLWSCVETALDVLAGTAADRGLDLVSYVEESPRWVTGDASRLRQVLVNLVGNAVKFTPAGAVSVVVTGETGDDGGQRLSFAVTDSGVGIPAASISTLFRPFSQVDASTTRLHGGTGLGLAISRRLVEAMGGRLEVESTVGVGSTFRFSIDAGSVPTGDEPSGLPVSDEVSALADFSVLLIDPGAVKRSIVRRQLERWGMRCTDVATPAAGLDLLAGRASYDVVVLDAGADGPQVGSTLQHHVEGPVLPVIVLTPLSVAVDRRGAGVTFLFTPVKSAQLSAALLAALDTGPQPPLPTQERRGVDPPVASARLRLLLAEDNPVNQKVARLMLAQLGHAVDVVANGAEAVDAVRRAPYDVVLMDVQMPVMDGLAAARQIRALLPPERQPRIIAMTASALIGDRAACIDAGMDGYLTKPVRTADLRSALDGTAAPAPR